MDIFHFIAFNSFHVFKHCTELVTTTKKKFISIFTTEPEKVGRSEKGKTFFPYRVEGNLITVDINL